MKLRFLFWRFFNLARKHNVEIQIKEASRHWHCISVVRNRKVISSRVVHTYEYDVELQNAVRIANRVGEALEEILMKESVG